MESFVKSVINSFTFSIDFGFLFALLHVITLSKTEFQLGIIFNSFSVLK